MMMYDLSFSLSSHIYMCVYIYISSQFPAGECFFVAASPSQLRMSDTRGDVSDFSMWSEDEELIDPRGNLKSNSARRCDSQRGIRSKGGEQKSWSFPG